MLNIKVFKKLSANFQTTINNFWEDCHREKFKNSLVEEDL